MLALPQEYIGSLCEIKSLTNDSLAVGRVIKIDNEALELAAGEGDRMPLLQYGMPVKLFVSSDYLATRIMVGVAYLSTTNFARVEEVKPLQDFERRGAFRVNTDVTGHLEQLLNEGEQAAFDALLFSLPEDEAANRLASLCFDVRVMDISLTGVRLASEKPLIPGDRYDIKFAPLRQSMSLCLRVQRLITMPNGTIQFGCIFFDFTERQMDTLFKELFQLQRMERSRRANAVL